MSKGQPIDGHTFSAKPPEINKLFNAMIKAGGSDLHLKVGLCPRMRIQGSLRNTKAAALTEQSMEDLVFDRVYGRSMRHTDWAYTGGRFGRDGDTGKRYYEATENGVFAAVYRDPSAVLNNPLKGGTDDTYYCVNDTMVPPRGTRCTLVILPAKPKDDEEE